MGGCALLRNEAYFYGKTDAGFDVDVCKRPVIPPPEGGLISVSSVG
jgi:hypothetical protein